MSPEQKNTAEITKIIQSSIIPGKFDELLELQVRTLTGGIPLAISPESLGKPIEITIGRLESYSPLDVISTIFSLWNESDLDYRLFASMFFLRNKKHFADERKLQLFEILNRHISSPNLSLRIFIALLLGLPGEPGSISLLMRLLEDESEFVRAEALQSLVRLEGLKTVPTIVNKYRADNELLVRHTALRLLKELDDGTLKSIFLDALNSPFEDLFVEACDYFTRKKYTRAVELLKEKSSSIRHLPGRLAISYAHYYYGNPLKLNDIIKYLNLGKSHFHLNVRVYAARFLGNIAEDSSDKTILNKIHRALEEARKEEKINIVMAEIEISINKTRNRMNQIKKIGE